MSIRIRLVYQPEKIDKKYLKIINKLDNHFFPGVPYPKEGGYWWVAFDNNKPVGYAGLDPLKSKEKAFLSRAGVKASHRGRGIHKRLIKARERMARKLGFTRLVTYTSYDNIASSNSLIRRGYIRYEPVIEYGVDHAIYFCKDL